MTSSWTPLVEAAQPDVTELWLQLEQRTESGPEAALGAKGAFLQETLAPVLAAVWSCRVQTYAVAYRETDDTNAADVLRRILVLLPNDRSTELIVDLTHGFRTMPMRVFSAIQIQEGFVPGLFARTRIMYGELRI